MAKKLNKELSTRKIVEYVYENKLQQSCTKLPIDNIVFPKWSDMGLYGQIFSQKVKTKEQPVGCDYSEAKFQTVMRILGGKVLMNSRPDTYAWNFEKVDKIKDKRPIGIGSAMGVINMSKLICSVTAKDEALLISEFFRKTNGDFILAHSPAEDRTCFYVSEELYNNGLKYIVDEWMDTDSEGMATATNVYPGDYIILSSDGGIYRIGADEFHETHKLNK